MITNEVQRRTTEGHLRQFDEALANLEAKSSGKKRQGSPSWRSTPSAPRPTICAPSSMSTTGSAPARCQPSRRRHSRSWRSCSSRPASPAAGANAALADVLGIAEQQVQRYESTGYRSASLVRICDIAAALDVTITERLSLRGPDAV